MLQFIRNLFGKKSVTPATLSEMAAAAELDLTEPEVAAKYFSVEPDRFKAVRMHNPYKNDDVAVVHFFHRNDGDLVAHEEIEAEMSRRGLRPATIDELLGYAARIRKIDCGLAVVSLGSFLDLGMANGKRLRRVPCIQGRRGERKLILRWVPGAGWWPCYGFLAVRKS